MLTTFLMAELGLALGISIGNFLLKAYCGEFAASSGGGFLDFSKDQLKDKIKDARAARKAERAYEQVGEDVVKRIENDLQATILQMDEPRPDANKIIERFVRILSGKVSASFVIRRQIDPQKLAEALRTTEVPNAAKFTDAEQRLFDNTAHQVAQYLFRAASKLPEFDAACEEESIASLLQVTSEVSEVLEDARVIRQHVVTRPLTDESDYETSYRNAVVAELDKVELFGVDLPPELRESRLTDAYVTLRLRPSDDPEDQDDDDDSTKAPEVECSGVTVTAEEALNQLRPGAGRMLVRGGAGCGKTTLVRWAAIEAARGTSKDWREIPEYEKTPDGDIRLLHDDEKTRIAHDWRRKIPFVIALRNCVDGKLPRPDDFPVQIGNEVGNPPQQWVQRLLQNGHALILIDGIDEVSKLNHKDLYDSVKRLISAFHKDNYFLLTTRPDAVADVCFEDLEFVPTDVEPLEEQDRELFIQHWFSAVAEKLKYSAKQKQELQVEATTIAKLIEQTPWLAQLATTPLYCAMTCALYRAGRGTLPQGLRAMCETLCEMMVDRRDRQRKILLDAFPNAYSQLDYSQKKLMLRRLAHFFILAGRSAIPVPVAIEQVGKSLAGMMHRSEKEAREVFESLVVRSGMLRLAAPARDDRPATVQFVHNTFKEFLAGEQLADEANADFLVNQLTDETWRRVGLFAVSAGNAKYQNAVLSEMLRQIPDPLPKQRKKKGMTDTEIANTPRDRAIYAYRCGVLGNEWEHDVKNRLSKLTRELFPPKSLSEAEWLASAGNVAIPRLKLKTSAYAHVIAACVRALRLIGTREAIDAIRTYENDHRAAVQSELVKALPSQVLPGIVRSLRSNDLSMQIRAYVTDEVLRNIEPFHCQTLDLQKTAITDLTPLQSLNHILSLDVSLTRISDLTPLQHLTNLIWLSLYGTPAVDLTPLTNLSKLRSLYYRGTMPIGLTPLANLTQLHQLALYGPVKDLTPLSNLTRLVSISLNGLEVTDLSPLENLRELRTIGLYRMNVPDLTPLEKLPELQTLSVSVVPLSNLAGLGTLTQLESLSISGIRVMDLSPLQNLEKLKILRLSGTHVTDLTPLQRLINLHTLQLNGTVVPEDQLRELRNELTDLRVC